MAVALRLAVVLSIGAAAYEGWRHAIQASKSNWAAIDAGIRCASGLSENLLETLSRQEAHGNFDVSRFGCGNKSPFITNMSEILDYRRGDSNTSKYQRPIFEFDILLGVALSWFFGVLLAGLVAWSALRTLRWVLKG